MGPAGHAVDRGGEAAEVLRSCGIPFYLVGKFVSQNIRLEYISDEVRLRAGDSLEFLCSTQLVQELNSSERSKQTCRGESHSQLNPLESS